MQKKVNAVLGLAITAALLVHIIYEIYAYLTFYYNPVLTKILAFTTLGLGALHILLSAFIVFISHDKGKGIRYPALNIRTLLQRISAVAIAVMLILHMNTFAALSATAGTSRALFVTVLIVQVLFYLTVFVHIAVSASNAFITLGIISSGKARKTLDIIIWILCAILFAAASFVVVKTQVAMFLTPGGAV